MSKSIGILLFSPTNTTKKISSAVSAGMGVSDPEIIDITRPDVRRKIISKPDMATAHIDHLIVGAPVYFGKLPLEAIECLKSINGNGKPSTAIVVYGNRDYGKALYCMVELLLKNNFKVSSAGAFIGQHSYSDIVPVAIGRPDKADLDNAYVFGNKSNKITECLSLEKVPIQSDMFSRSDRYIPLKPTFIADRCVQCGICADVCPTGIISPETGDLRHPKDKRRCIGCMACVRNCGQNARIVKVGKIMELSMKYILRKAAVERQAPLMIYP